MWQNDYTTPHEPQYDHYLSSTRLRLRCRHKTWLNSGSLRLSAADRAQINGRRLLQTTYWVVVAESIRLCSYDLLENKQFYLCNNGSTHQLLLLLFWKYTYSTIRMRLPIWHLMQLVLPLPLLPQSASSAPPVLHIRIQIILAAGCLCVRIVILLFHLLLFSLILSVRIRVERFVLHSKWRQRCTR